MAKHDKPDKKGKKARKREAKAEKARQRVGASASLATVRTSGAGSQAFDAPAAPSVRRFGGPALLLAAGAAAMGVLSAILRVRR